MFSPATSAAGEALRILCTNSKKRNAAAEAGQIHARKEKSMTRKILVALAGLVVLMTASIGTGQEKKIARRDLPAAVEKTVAEQSKGSTISGFSTEMEHGKRIYEANLVVNGHRRDISMDADGKILEVEEAVPLESLPAKVRESL